MSSPSGLRAIRDAKLRAEASQQRRLRDAPLFLSPVSGGDVTYGGHPMAPRSPHTQVQCHSRSPSPSGKASGSPPSPHRIFFETPKWQSEAVRFEVDLVEKKSRDRLEAEAREERGLQRKPSAKATRVALQSLEDLKSVIPPFSRVLETIHHDLEEAIFIQEYTTSGASASEEYVLEQLPYFEAFSRVQHLLSKVEAEKERLNARVKEMRERTSRQEELSALNEGLQQQVEAAQRLLAEQEASMEGSLNALKKTVGEETRKGKLFEEELQITKTHFLSTREKLQQYQILEQNRKKFRHDMKMLKQDLSDTEFMSMECEYYRSMSLCEELSMILSCRITDFERLTIMSNSLLNRVLRDDFVECCRELTNEMHALRQHMEVLARRMESREKKLDAQLVDEGIEEEEKGINRMKTLLALGGIPASALQHRLQRKNSQGELSDSDGEDKDSVDGIMSSILEDIPRLSVGSEDGVDEDSDAMETPDTDGVEMQSSKKQLLQQGRRQWRSDGAAGDAPVSYIPLADRLKAGSFSTASDSESRKIRTIQAFAPMPEGTIPRMVIEVEISHGRNDPYSTLRCLDVEKEGVSEDIHLHKQQHDTYLRTVVRRKKPTAAPLSLGLRAHSSLDRQQDQLHSFWTKRRKARGLFRDPIWEHFVELYGKSTPYWPRSLTETTMYTIMDGALDKHFRDRHLKRIDKEHPYPSVQVSVAEFISAKYVLPEVSYQVHFEFLKALKKQHQKNKIQEFTDFVEVLYCRKDPAESHIISMVRRALTLMGSMSLCLSKHDVLKMFRRLYADLPESDVSMAFDHLIECLGTSISLDRFLHVMSSLIRCGEDVRTAQFVRSLQGRYGSYNDETLTERQFTESMVMLDPVTTSRCWSQRFHLLGQCLGMDSSERRHLPLRGLSVIGAEVLWWNRFTMLTEQLLHQIFNSSYCPAGHRTDSGDESDDGDGDAEDAEERDTGFSL